METYLAPVTVMLPRFERIVPLDVSTFVDPPSLVWWPVLALAGVVFGLCITVGLLAYRVKDVV